MKRHASMAASTLVASTVAASMVAASMVVLAMLVTTTALAQPSPPPRPYAIPFQLRPVIAPNVARLESTLDVERGGASVVELATLAYRVAPDLSIVGRAAYVVDLPAMAGAEGAFANPMLGALYTPEVAPGLRLASFVGVALPLGQGDGLTSTDFEVIALSRGRIARASMDNALFATSYATIAVGAALGWLVERFTLQLEVTLLGAFRARSAADVVVDNLTMGAWIAYAILDELFVGVAVHHQHFLSTPALVRSGGENTRGQTSIAVAVRARIPLDGSVFFAPGVSYTRGVDGALDMGDANIVTLDLALPF